mgnify:FL=1
MKRAGPASRDPTPRGPISRGPIFQGPLSRGLVAALAGLVRLYQGTLAYWLGGRCRFTPTCSEYALQALQDHGPFLGAALAAWRVLRCSPLSRGGEDPVPPGRTGAT